MDNSFIALGIHIVFNPKNTIGTKCRLDYMEVKAKVYSTQGNALHGGSPTVFPPLGNIVHSLQ
jgi:hypothetical protein